MGLLFIIGGCIAYANGQISKKEIESGIGGNLVVAGIVTLFSWIFIDLLKQFQVGTTERQDYYAFCRAVRSGKSEIVIFTTYTYLLMKRPSSKLTQLKQEDRHFELFDDCLNARLNTVLTPTELPSIRILLIHPLSPAAQARIDERAIIANTIRRNQHENILNSMREGMRNAYELKRKYESSWKSFEVKFYETLPRMSYFRVDRRYARCSFFPFGLPQSDAKCLELVGAGESSRVLEYMQDRFDEVWEISSDISYYMHVACNVCFKGVINNGESSEEMRFIGRDTKDHCIYIFGETKGPFWEDAGRAINDGWSIEVGRLGRLFAIHEVEGRGDNLTINAQLNNLLIQKHSTSVPLPNLCLSDVDKDRNITLATLYERKYGATPCVDYCYRVELVSNNEIHRADLNV